MIFQSLQNYLFKYVECTGWTTFRANIILIIDNIESNLSPQVQVISRGQGLSESFEDIESTSFRSKQVPKVNIHSFTHKTLTRGPSHSKNPDAVQWTISAIFVQSLNHVQLFVTSWTAACRFLCPSLSPNVCSNSCSLSWWCHPTISFSVTPFSSCLQSFWASGSFPMSWLFTLGGQSIGVLASTIVFPVDTDAGKDNTNQNFVFVSLYWGYLYLSYSVWN